jgi:hypothetical protein
MMVCNFNRKALKISKELLLFSAQLIAQDDVDDDDDDEVAERDFTRRMFIQLISIFYYY